MVHFIGRLPLFSIVKALMAFMIIANPANSTRCAFSGIAQDEHENHSKPWFWIESRQMLASIRFKLGL
tara:strand:- start:37 stop:240 length:204 start_codon:yes stop_codon:yes gene_type:complete